jgi:hypothetical protein
VQHHAGKYRSCWRRVRCLAHSPYLGLVYANPKARIDLTAASSVHIVEPHWNPMAEAQAIDRIHRIGQQQGVKVVRYIVSESIESVSTSSVLRMKSNSKNPVLT